MMSYEVTENIGDSYLIRITDDFLGIDNKYYRFYKKYIPNYLIESRKRYTTFHKKYFIIFAKTDHIRWKNRLLTSDPKIFEAINIFDRKAKLRKLLS